MIFLEITEKLCIKESHPHSEVKVQLVQHCTAISAIAELLILFLCKLIVGI